MNYSLYQILCFFMIYAFLGWCAEVCYAAVTTGKVINRGFLNGPVCPIYGCGMVGVLLLLEPIAENFVLLFFCGMLLTTSIELIGGWILKKVFDLRWWDYSKRPFNLGGYICLEFTIIWGLAVVFVMKIVHPVIGGMVDHLPVVLGWVLIGVFYALFIADFVITLITIIGFKKKLGELERIADGLHSVSDNLSERIGTSTIAADEKFEKAKEAGQERMAEGREMLEKAKEAGQEKMAEGREKLEDVRESAEQRFDDSREKLAAAKEAGMERLEEAKLAGQERMAKSREKTEELAELLDTKKRELLESITAGNRFGVRRITSAFPSLTEAINERLEKFMDRKDEE